jgi:hypothetical protein
MRYPHKLLFRSLVGPFYKENISLFFFLFAVMVGIVGEVDGAELWQFHYSLALGILQNSSYVLFVFAAWFLYARKCMQFVSGLLRQPHYSFVIVYNNLDRTKRFGLFLLVVVWLLLPVLIYGAFVVVYGWLRHLYVPIAVVAAYLLSLCFFPALWLVYLSENLYKDKLFKIKYFLSLPSAYGVVLLRFIVRKQKIMWLGFTIFTCGSLYMVALNNTVSDYETVFPFLFYNFGILSQGIIVFGIREYEETWLNLYRGAPVSLLKRLRQYSLVYFVLLIPEFITAGLLVPVHLHFGDAVLFSACGYGLVLLMNGITFVRNFSRKEYLFLLLIIFCAQYIFLVGPGLPLLCGVLFAAAIVCFLAGYYQFERVIVQ